MYKVLLVEDEDIIRKGLRYMVDWMSAGCLVVGEAVDGEDGLSKIRELKPDIVITDIRMPFMDGLEMLEKSILAYKYEAIIVTGYGEFDYAKKAISLGVEEYLLKPINFEELYRVLEALTSKLNTRKAVKDLEETIENINLYRNILDVNHLALVENSSDSVSLMVEYIKKNYSKKISINDLEDRLGLSKVSLNNKFKKATNYTFTDFLNRYRILKSIELLKNGDYMVYEIAEEVGFLDYKYFSQVFKKYVGFSPTEFLENVETII